MVKSKILMHRYRLNPRHFPVSLVDDITKRFLSGEVGILPTETVYGLMGLRDNPGVTERIYTIKQRDHSRKFQILIPSLDYLHRFDIPLSPILQHLATRFWPGPLTLVLRDRKGEDIGLRIPNDRFLIAVLAKMEKPLVATSANVSGGDPGKSLANDFSDLAFPPDFIVTGDVGIGRPSTVLRVNGNKVEIIREGAISIHTIQNVLNKIPNITFSNYVDVSVQTRNRN